MMQSFIAIEKRPSSPSTRGTKSLSISLVRYYARLH